MAFDYQVSRPRTKGIEKGKKKLSVGLETRYFYRRVAFSLVYTTDERKISKDSVLYTIERRKKRRYRDRERKKRKSLSSVCFSKRSIWPCSFPQLIIFLIRSSRLVHLVFLSSLLKGEKEREWGKSYLLKFLKCQ